MKLRLKKRAGRFVSRRLTFIEKCAPRRRQSLRDDTYAEISTDTAAFVSTELCEIDALILLARIKIDCSGYAGDFVASFRPTDSVHPRNFCGGCNEETNLCNADCSNYCNGDFSKSILCGNSSASAAWPAARWRRRSWRRRWCHWRCRFLCYL